MSPFSLWDELNESLDRHHDVDVDEALIDLLDRVGSTAT
jgi:hypothetical protein